MKINFQYFFSKYSFERIGSDTKTADQTVGQFLNSQISQNIHDQGQSYLCWAYSCSTMIRRSLIYFFMNHKDDLDLNLTIEEKCDLEYEIKSNKFHFILRNQILMNPIPKRLKKEETEAQRGPHETHPIGAFLERVSHSL